MKEHSRLSNIQALRAIAAIMVMLLHVAGMATSLGFTSWVQPFQLVGFVGIDIFFVISGLVITLTTYHHLGEKGHVLTFIRRRTVRIYSNYWVILLIMAALIWLGWKDMREGARVLESMFLIPQRGRYNMVPVAWTLIYEMFFYMVFILAILLPRKYFLPFLLSWFTIMLGSNLFLIERVKGMPFFLNFYFSPLQLEFIAGCFIGLMVIKRIVIHPLLMLLAGVTIITIVATVTHEAPLIRYKDVLLRTLWYGSGAALLVYGAVMLEVTRSWRSPRWLNKLGDASYTIYLIHTMFLHVMVRLVYHPVVKPHDSMFLQQGFMLLVMLMILAYSVLHYRFIEKPLLTWCNAHLKRLIGH